MGNEKGPDADASTLAALEAGLAELERRKQGEFDGLLGEFPEEKSKALRDITYYLRDYLLDKHGYDEETVRRMLDNQYEYEDGMQWGPASEGVELALDLLGLIGSAFKSDAYHVLLSGKDGWKGARQREGGHEGARRRHKGPNPAPKRARVIEADKKDDGPKWGRIARIAKKAGCKPQYAGKVLKENRS